MIKPPAPVTATTKLPKGPLRVVVMDTEACEENANRALVGGKIFRPPFTIYTFTADGAVTDTHTAFGVRGGLQLVATTYKAPFTIPHVDVGRCWLQTNAELTLLPVSELHRS